MSDASQKSSEELAAELQKLMPVIKSSGSGWRPFGNIHAVKPTQYLFRVAKLVLAQQQEIEQLKAELEELKQQ